MSAIQGVSVSNNRYWHISQNMLQTYKLYIIKLNLHNVYYFILI